MKGSAPKSPETGSHVEVVQNFRPNFEIDNADCRVNSKAIPRTISNTSAANAPVPMRKLRSSEERFIERSLNGRERLHFLRDDRLRQRRGAESVRELLAVGE